MAKLIRAVDKIQGARKLIQKARDLPVASNSGWGDFSYVAQVKDLLRQAKDLVKLIPHSPTATPEIKEDVAAIYREAEQTEKELLHRS